MPRQMAESVRSQRRSDDLLSLATRFEAGDLLSARATVAEHRAAARIVEAGRALLIGDVNTARSLLAGLDLSTLPHLVHSDVMGVIARTYEATGDLESYAFILESLLDDSLFDKSPRLIAHLGVDLVSSYVCLGYREAALAAAQAALMRLPADADVAGPRVELAAAVVDLLAERGQMDGAALACDRLMEWQRHAPQAVRGLAHWSAANLRAAQGDWPGSLLHTQRAVLFLEGNAPHGQIARVWLHAARCLLELDAHPAAEAALLAAQAEGAGNLALPAYRGARDRDALARAYLDRAEDTWPQPVPAGERGMLSLVRAVLDLRGGHVERSLENANRALAALAARPRQDRCISHLVLGELCGHGHAHGHGCTGQSGCSRRPTKLLAELAAAGDSAHVWRELSAQLEPVA